MVKRSLIFLSMFFIFLIIILFTISNCSFEKNNENKINVNNTNNNTIINNKTNDNSGLVKIENTTNMIVKSYFENKKNFSLYDPYKKTLYYGFTIIKNNPCQTPLTQDKLESLDKNYVIVNVELKNSKNNCIQILKEEYIFRKSIFLQKPDVIKVYYNNTLIMEKNITILNLSYKNIDSYEKLNSLCGSYPESERVKCCEENSVLLPRIMCLGSWIWDNGCKYECGITPIK